MVSPILETSPNSRWSHATVCLTFLQSHEHISTNVDCATHVHVSLDLQYEFRNVKRVAVLAIQFEPAFEVLMPRNRRANWCAKRTWLSSTQSGPKGRSRSQFIGVIDVATSIGQLLYLLQERVDENFSWNCFKSRTSKDNGKISSASSVLDAS
jgi:Putative amidoligase enzyme